MANYPDVHTIAEESTAWPMVSQPTYVGGLGFGMKWMMGWMHDTLDYFQKDPVYRSITRTILPLVCIMPLPKTLCCPFRMMKWSMVRVPYR